jgi:hypothetical protein
MLGLLFTPAGGRIAPQAVEPSLEAVPPQAINASLHLGNNWLEWLLSLNPIFPFVTLFRLRRNRLERRFYSLRRVSACGAILPAVYFQRKGTPYG